MWHRVAAESEIDVGRVTEVIIDDRIIALGRAAESWFAIEGTCPHHGGPLGQGVIVGCDLVCPWHGLRVNHQTGEFHLGAPDSLPCFQVKVEDGEVFIRLDQPQPNTHDS